MMVTPVKKRFQQPWRSEHLRERMFGHRALHARNCGGSPVGSLPSGVPCSGSGA